MQQDISTDIHQPCAPCANFEDGTMIFWLRWNSLSANFTGCHSGALAGFGPAAAYYRFIQSHFWIHQPWSWCSLFLTGNQSCRYGKDPHGSLGPSQSTTPSYVPTRQPESSPHYIPNNMPEIPPQGRDRAALNRRFSTAEVWFLNQFTYISLLFLFARDMRALHLTDRPQYIHSDLDSI